VCSGGKGSVVLISNGKAFNYGGDATTDLAAGTNYTVTDANGCIATTSVTIDAAPANNINCYPSQMCVSVVKVLLF
jgi:hypothetical protein